MKARRVSRRRRHTGWRAGFAIADFLTGTLILAGALTAFAGMTRTKFAALAGADQHARALAAAEEAVDRVRTAGLPRAPHGDADADGFRPVVEFTPSGLPGATGRVEARSLRLADGAAHDLFEARVVVRWKDGPSTAQQVWLSTIASAKR